jgi:hypothetical protein
MMLQQAWPRLGQLGVAWVHLGYIKYIGICEAKLACSKVDHLTPVVNTTQRPPLGSEKSGRLKEVVYKTEV